MAQFEEIRRFVKINTDISLQDMGEGDYLDMLNGRINKAGNVENIPSNLLVDNPYLDPGVNVCVGVTEDIKRSSLIFAVCNSNNEHTIFTYNHKTKVISKIIEQNGLLGFVAGKHVFMDVIGDWLFWSMD